MVTKAPLWAIKRVVEEGIVEDDFRAVPIDELTDYVQTYAIYTPKGDFVLRFHASVAALQRNIGALFALKGLGIAPAAVSAGWCEGLAYTFEELVPGVHFPYKDIPSKERVLPAVIQQLTLFKKANTADFAKEKKPHKWIKALFKSRLMSIWDHFPRQEIIAFIKKRAPSPDHLQLVHGEPYWQRMLFHEKKIRFVHFHSSLMGEPEVDPGVLYYTTPVSDEFLGKLVHLGGYKRERILYHALLFGVKAYLTNEKDREKKLERIQTIWSKLDF